MPTPEELRDAAVAELKLTTAGWRKSNGTLNYPSGVAPMTTHWGKAMKFLEQIGEVGDPPPNKTGLGYLKLGNGSPPATHFADYERLLVTFRGAYDWSDLDVSRVVAYSSPFRLLNGADYHGMSAEEARANGWLLKNSSGAEIVSTWGSGNDRMADIGNPAFQLKWCQNIEAYFGPKGVKGFYMDDYNRAAWLCASTPTKYPTTAQWEAATVSLAQFVSNYFKPKGWYVVANVSGYTPGSSTSSNGDDDVAYFSKVGPHLSAAMCEFFQITNQGNIRLSGSATSQQWWDGWQRLVPLCNSMGIDLIAISFGGPDGGPFSAAKRDYCLASFLLDYDGSHGMFVSAPTGTTGPDPWNASFDKVRALGAPLGSKTKSGNRWSRSFTNGSVWVDTVAGTAAIG